MHLLHVELDEEQNPKCDEYGEWNELSWSQSIMWGEEEEAKAGDRSLRGWTFGCIQRDFIGQNFADIFGFWFVLFMKTKANRVLNVQIWHQ